jgi:hypothetical protein
MRRSTSLRLGVVASLVALAMLAGEAASSVSAAPAGRAASDLARCPDGSHSLARVKAGGKGQEPALYAKNQANAYGVLDDLPTLPSGSVHVPTVFHMISDHENMPAERERWEDLIAAQMDVLNDAFSGSTAPDAADTPFRFDLTGITWSVNADWYTVVPGKAGHERAMKRSLYGGDARTLHVYAANIGGNLLGWAYFPKGYNHGRDFVDGIVILDESMPGGTAGKYAFGDTLVHEVGHWLLLEHTFAHGCSASGDWVTDTPPEAHPQFDCPVGADTCAAPGLDPIRNFMDYTQDTCMDMFTQGQADRMSDAWLQFRAGGGKS